MWCEECGWGYCPELSDFPNQEIIDKAFEIGFSEDDEHKTIVANNLLDVQKIELIREKFRDIPIDELKEFFDKY